MKTNFKEVTLILCFSAITIIDALNDDGLVGGCQEMSPTEFQSHAEAQAGFQKLKSKLVARVNCNPGYNPEVDLPGIKTCSQVVAGVSYQYKWSKEEYRCINRNANSRPYILKTKFVNCEASYWVIPWENFAQLREPVCS